MQPALLNIEEGEIIYKCGTSEWLVDADGPIMWRFISKKRKDGKIEMVIFTQRQDNRKHIMQYISFAESEFLGIIQAVRQAMWQLFPGAKFETNDFNDMPSSAYHTARTDTPLGFWKIRLIWYWGALVNGLRWLFLRKPPN